MPVWPRATTTFVAVSRLREAKVLARPEVAGSRGIIVGRVACREVGGAATTDAVRLPGSSTPDPVTMEFPGQVIKFRYGSSYPAGAGSDEWAE